VLPGQLRPAKRGTARHAHLQACLAELQVVDVAGPRSSRQLRRQLPALLQHQLQLLQHALVRLDALPGLLCGQLQLRQHAAPVAQGAACRAGQRRWQCRC
jgi:hypothetical protein